MIFFNTLNSRNLSGPKAAPKTMLVDDKSFLGGPEICMRGVSWNTWEDLGYLC